MTTNEHYPDKEWVGSRVRRKEDRRLVTGRGRYVADIGAAGMLYAAFARSPIANGVIASVDKEDALRVPGVVAVFDAEDLDMAPLIANVTRPEFRATEMPPLARGRVKFQGDPVAIVVAESPYSAEDGVEALIVEYEDVDPVSSIAGGIAPGAPLVHENAPGNVLIDLQLFDSDGLTEAIDEAPVAIEATFNSSRLSALPMETRGCLAEWNTRDKQLVVHSSTQCPHQVRSAIAIAVGLPENMVRVIAPDVGGGFGLKVFPAREEIATAAAALRVGRPIQWIEDRTENLAASYHSREQDLHIRAGFDLDGRLLAISADILCDVGAYAGYPHTSCIEPLMAATELPGAYKVPRYGVRARAVATHKAPFGPYRGVSRPQIVLVMERLMEKAAARLQMDSNEVRRRNLIQPEDFPYTGVNNISYDPGSYVESLNVCIDRITKDGWYEQAEAMRSEGRAVGIGFACFNERTAYGTPTMAARQLEITAGYDTSRVWMDPNGHVIVTTGTASHGQGHETAFAQIAADALGLTPDDIDVRQGDTDLTTYGWGTFGSRSAVIGGGAIQRAALGVAEQLKVVAASMLDANPEDIELGSGLAFVRTGTTGQGEVAITTLARRVYFESQHLPDGVEPTLSFEATYDPVGTFSNATHACFVEIDPATGGPTVTKFLVVEDCGKVINPIIVDGQVRGGIAQGIGAALYERHSYDSQGQLATSSLMDYLVPTCAEIPSIDIMHLETPSPWTSMGTKGMGEGSAIGAPAAVVNAVNDAIKRTGVEIDQVPITPEVIAFALDKVSYDLEGATS